MPILINRLDALKIKRLNSPGLYADGAGLYLQVSGTGARSWIFRFKRDGRTRDMGLGSVLTFTLAEARQAALDARKLLAIGIDPIEARRAQQIEKNAQAARVLSFREEAEAYIQAHQSSWRNAKHAEQWRSTLEAYAYPTIGSVAVADVDTGMIVKILEPIWSKKTETANRVRGRIERILSRSASRGHRSSENPAQWRGHLENVLPARGRVAPVQHHAALHYSRVGDFIRELRTQPGIAAQALELTILCTTRTSETIGARPGEFDLADNIWTIPAERMKMKREHRIPLTPRAVEIIERMLKDAGEFVFPGPDPQKHLSNNAMLALLERMGRGDITVHGFRSSFKDWASESTGYPPEVAEMALAHVVHDKVEAAYRRGDLFAKRRLLMKAWAEFCLSPSRGNKVISMKSAIS
jgi:integrase